MEALQAQWLAQSQVSLARARVRESDLAQRVGSLEAQLQMARNTERVLTARITDLEAERDDLEAMLEEYQGGSARFWP